MVGESTASRRATLDTLDARSGASTMEPLRLVRPRLEQDDRVEIRCTRCGYGAVVTSPPRRCPMCGGDGWRLAKRVNALPMLSE